MSEHYIEDLVEHSVLALDRHAPAGAGEVRDALVALFRFQRQHDCAHTMGRVQDVLLGRGHTYRFPLSEYPDLAMITDFTELGDDDTLDDGYVDPPWLYCEAGTALWKRMVEAGRLHGPDAVAPRHARLLDVVVSVCEAAAENGDADLIALWWALGPDSLMTTVLPVEDLAEDPAVRRLRDLVRRTGASDVPLPDGYRPTDDDLDTMDDDVETWWYRLDQG
ncbi:hypothetical protein ACIA8K_11255 [Catenuloplanes sp. NPDC051500]|uniref:hypothetical protein n=1 Tax=Catenuloplanes sp. NPDC051500 TaxID=3363959 RepID=UPI00378B43B2